MICLFVDEALSAANVLIDAIDAIAVCCGRSIGSLLVGCGFAKAAGYARQFRLSHESS